MKEEPRPAGASLRRRLFVVGLGFLLLVMLMTSFFGKKGVMDLRRARRELTALKIEAERLQGERERLRQEIADLERDPRAVELEARDKLGLVRPDEKVVVTKRKAD